MKFRVILLLLLIISIIFTGCSFNRNELQNDNVIDEENIQQEMEDGISLDVGGKDYDLLIRSEGISDAVVKLFGIDNATSIIFNDKVAVALEMAEGHDFTQDVKQTVINTVKEKDSSISEVLVSDDKRIFNEIESVILALLNGESYDEQVNKISKIMESMR